METKKRDLRTLSKIELLEMLQRQKKLLANKRFFQSLPDKGDKINQLVDQLKALIVSKEQLEALSSRFGAIRVSGVMRNSQQAIDLDSDDEDDVVVDDSSTKPTTTQESQETNITYTLEKPIPPRPESTAESGSSAGKKTPLGTYWDYDSAVTHARFHKCEKAKSISLEESFQLQQQQNRQCEALRAEQAATRLQEQMRQAAASRQDGQTSTYRFTSKKAKYRYRDTNKVDEYIESYEDDSDSEEDEAQDIDDD